MVDYTQSSNPDSLVGKLGGGIRIENISLDGTPLDFNSFKTPNILYMFKTDLSGYYVDILNGPLESYTDFGGFSLLVVQVGVGYIAQLFLGYNNKIFYRSQIIYNNEIIFKPWVSLDQFTELSE